MYLLLSRLAFCFQRKECNVWRVKKVCFSNWCFIFTRFECLSDRYTPHLPLVCSRLCFHPVQNYHKDTRFEYLSHWYTGHTPFSLYFHSAQSEHKTAKQHKTDQSGSQHLQWVKILRFEHFSTSCHFHLLWISHFPLLWMGVRKIEHSPPPALPPSKRQHFFSWTRLTMPGIMCA